VWQAERPALDTTIHHLTDSLTNGGFHVSTSDMIGAKTPDLFGADGSKLTGFPDPGADIEIIGLGTNDANNLAVPVAQYEANLRNWIDAQSTTTCFWLVNIYTGATSWGLDVTAPAYNAALNRIAADDPTVHIADWNAQALAHQSTYFDDPTQPHGNATGQAAYRNMITLLAAACAVWAGSPS
jgi:hypothetical protein